MIDSKLFIELSAIRNRDSEDGLETCNDNLAAAEAFAVYIHNPLAFHVMDFFPVNISLATYHEVFKEVFDAAKLFASGLAEHLGCPLEIMCPEPTVTANLNGSENVPSEKTSDDVSST